MTAPSRIMIPPLLDQEGKPSHRRRQAALLGIAVVVVAIIVVIVILVFLRGTP